MITVLSAATAPRAAGLLEHDRWSRDELLAHQRAGLHDLLEHAVSASPYYREVLGPDAMHARLEELPVLSKRTLMEQFDRVSTDPRLRLAAAEEHAAGSDPAALLDGRYHLFATSGTSGWRGIFPETRAEFEQWITAAWRAVGRFGIEPGARTIGIAAPTPLHVTQKLFASLGGFGAGRPTLTVSAPPAELFGTLEREQPRALFTLPTVAGMLASHQLQGRLAIDPCWVVVAGEVLSEEVARRIDDAWGIRPFQVYGTTEALVLASESPERGGLDITEDLVIVEVVDEHDRAVAPGVPGYKLLLTSLVNRALPLIRYELPDCVTLAPTPDPSGRPYRRIARIDGRADDTLRLAGARGGEVVVLPHRLRAPFISLADVLQYQLVEHERLLTVRVVLRAGAGADVCERVASGVRDALRDAGALVPPIEVEQVAEIEREPGGAKLKLVKSLRR